MRGGPSMTALLGLLAVAGYQNRDKISEWLGGSGGQAAGGGATPPTDRPSGLDKLLPSGGAGGLGTMIHDGLSDLLGSFKQAGHGEVADSWVQTGPNKAIAPPDLEQAIGSDTLSQLEQRTGMSRADILKKLSHELPTAVDRYTPDGRLPGMA